MAFSFKDWLRKLMGSSELKTLRNGKDLIVVTVDMTRMDLAIALELGDGNASIGVRRALHVASASDGK